MGSAYIIVRIKRTRDEGWAEYRAEVTKLIAAFSGCTIVGAQRPEVLEGDEEDRQLVVLEFPSMEVIRAFWGSPEYISIKALRDRSGTLDAWAVRGKE